MDLKTVFEEMLCAMYTGPTPMPVRGGPHNPSLIDDLTGGLESLLQYYSFERKMEGYNPFSALD